VSSEEEIYHGINMVLYVPREAVLDIARPGRNDEAVGHWVGRVDWTGVSHDSVAAELREAGMEPDSYDEDQARRYLLWLACHNLADEGGNQ
jgi:hypothetical protein